MPGKFKTPKFKFGDVVQMEDEFSFNPAYRVLSIGTIQAIHIYRGKGIFKDEDKRGRITYTVTGFSLQPDECKLTLVEGE